jgi:hypothetical protein
MTPSELMAGISELVRSGQHRAALEFSDRHHAKLAPLPTAQQRTDIAQLVHIAQMAVDLEDASDGAKQATKARTA